MSNIGSFLSHNRLNRAEAAVSTNQLGVAMGYFHLLMEELTAKFVVSLQSQQRVPAEVIPDIQTAMEQLTSGIKNAENSFAQKIRIVAGKASREDESVDKDAVTTAGIGMANLLLLDYFKTL